jgi:hypothetical protein
MTAITTRPPQWWVDTEIERRVIRREHERARDERAYRDALANERGDIREIAREIGAAMIDTSELSPADYAALKAKALAMATMFGAISDALLYAEGGLQ